MVKQKNKHYDNLTGRTLKGMYRMSQNKKISMRPVSIIGVGCTPFGKSDSSIIDLAIQSSVEAINSANVKYDDIQSIYLGNLSLIHI